MIRKFIYIFAVICLMSNGLQAQENQVHIPRIDLMPDQPAPYVMRDWKQVAINYDRFVYDESKQGLYLPLIGFRAQGNNYPERPAFGLHTYVGTKNTDGFEAINVLPSLVGASLVGIDKTSQNGRNFVLMSQDFFNKKNEQNLYLNGTSSKSGNDWWYDMMPNVFFYQLYDLYPNAGGEAGLQFTAIADRMLGAVKAMGGSDIPWSKPEMNYRAWNFETMQPLVAGVPEPEAAGAFGWLLYHAYAQTGNKEYLKGAEWSVEFLNGLNGNPSYELQLPYGTYVAARMNAEVGTRYDVEKMVNWSFDRGNLRGWGTIVDKWSGLDVSGLVGESESSTDYAFQLNGIQQAAALVPMVRYDKRFAAAIGKWVLNLANANRLFYHGYLPSSLQDASDWSAQYDANRVIGYEAIREVYQGFTPFATGDAVRGGWASTNLALYGTSSIGYLGAMIETTNKDKVLKIDLLKTDFFRNEAYPSFLYYNPYNEAVVINLPVGALTADIYDALTESFVLKEQSGTIEITIPGKSARMIVICPANGELSFDKNKMLVNGVVVDYDQHQQEYARSLRIKSLAADASEWEVNKQHKLFATIETNGAVEPLEYLWKADGVSLDNPLETLETGFETTGQKKIQLTVIDGAGVADSAEIMVSVVDQINYPPVIYEIIKSERFGKPGAQINLTCEASEELDGPLIYAWTASAGVLTSEGKEASWMLPANAGVYELTVVVTDSSGLSTQKKELFLVNDFSEEASDAIAYYPLDGNAQDFSGNQLHGTIVGASNAPDREGENNKALFFNGLANHIVVPNQQILNFQDGITVSGWFKMTRKYDRESFLISHGSWNNRWKVSIIPEQKIRWTINTLNGVRDLDSKEVLEVDRFYHVAVSYDGNTMLIYVDGELVNFTAQTGKLRTTNLALFLGQSLPDQQDYNFQGVLDEFMIYDRALSPRQIASLYETGMITSLEEHALQGLDIKITPNPSSGRFRLQGEGLDQIDEVRAYSTSGQLLFKTTRSGIQDIDLSDHKSGVYWIQLIAKDQIIGIQKLFKI